MATFENRSYTIVTERTYDLFRKRYANQVINMNDESAVNLAGQNSTSKLWFALIAGLVLGGVTVLVTVDSGVQGEQLIRYTLRSTGHVSFLLFIVPMIAGPLDQLYRCQLSKFLLKNRTMFGLAFAGNHIWHMGFIVALYQLSPGQPEPLPVLIGGSLGLFYLLLMVMFSFPAVVGRAGQAAKRWVHRLSFYYLVGVFIYDIALRNWPEPNRVLFVLLLAALLIRLLSWAKGTSIGRTKAGA